MVSLVWVSSPAVSVNSSQFDITDYSDIIVFVYHAGEKNEIIKDIDDQAETEAEQQLTPVVVV